MEIFAPYLQHLEISGDLYDLKCILEDVSSVVTAKLTFNNVCIRNIQSDYNPAEDSCRLYHQFFLSLVHDSLVIFCNAKELTIGTWFTEFIGIIATSSVHVAVPRDFASRSEMQISDAGVACEEV
ncbi:hypothetical protein MTR67_020509 [Solanum verrucosum]|uniref:Uncharacterized protein n=1 Tax=Solanum verrucosum TaxID=315347 RepID=A0AAF0QWB1_SOLVR|nr:hypothetical protein MTR67_020509 [Solanum verrucosum]